LPTKKCREQKIKTEAKVQNFEKIILESSTRSRCKSEKNMSKTGKNYMRTSEKVKNIKEKIFKG